MTKTEITLWVNNENYTAFIEPRDRLLDVLRNLGFTGVKEGCGTGECGACSIIYDKKLVCSCMLLAIQAQGHDIITIEGLGNKEKMHPIQKAFVDTGAIQCGFCTPGLVIAAKCLLDENKHPSRDDVRNAISGNLCRCTGYVKIIDAVIDAAKRLQEGDQ